MDAQDLWRDTARGEHAGPDSNRRVVGGEDFFEIFTALCEK